MKTRVLGLSLALWSVPASSQVTIRLQAVPELVPALSAPLAPLVVPSPSHGALAAPRLTVASLSPAPKVEVKAEAIKAIPAMIWPFTKETPVKAEAAPADPGRALFDAGVKSIVKDKDGYTVNGAAAESIGFGSFKETLVHPANDARVVKVFRASFGSHSSVQEKRLEVSNIRLLEKISAAPRLIEAGAVSLDGKPTGFVVQERVRGSDLRTVDAAKLSEVRKLFDKLAAAGLEIADTSIPHKLRANIMVGTTATGGFKAYLVDADLVLSKLSKKDLKAFYDKVYKSLQR